MFARLLLHYIGSKYFCTHTIIGMSPAPASNDVRRRDRIVRYKPYVPKEGEDPMAEYMNLLAMLFSMCGLMMRFKWAAWAAVSF